MIDIIVFIIYNHIYYLSISTFTLPYLIGINCGYRK